jgi:hypothetical protein
MAAIWRALRVFDFWGYVKTKRQGGLETSWNV